MHNRQALNSIYHQTANAICKAAFERAATKVVDGANILVTSGGCGAGKGFGQKQLAKGNASVFHGDSSVVSSFAETFQGNKSKKKSGTALIWDSAGDQCSSELGWLKAVAKKNNLSMVVLQTNNVNKSMANSLATAQIGRALDREDGRMVTVKVSADSYVIGNKNIVSFYNANKSDKSISFYTVGNPGQGYGYDSKGKIVDNKDFSKPSLSIQKGIITSPASSADITKAIKEAAYSIKVNDKIFQTDVTNIISGVEFGDSHVLRS